jgi:hypothetical protein
MALVEAATAWWVGWFNNRRLYGPLGDIPPVAAVRAGHRAVLHVPRIPDHSDPADPTLVQDVFFQVGGATPGTVATASRWLVRWLDETGS